LFPGRFRHHEYQAAALTMTFKEFGWHTGRKLIYPALPPKMRLPFFYWLSLVAGFIEPELQCLEAICAARKVAIDVGANMGMFSYRLARIFRRVYAFEINDEPLDNLIAYNPGNIEIVNIGLSSLEDETTLYIPVCDNLPLTGWGSLSPDNCPEAQTHLTKSGRVRPLDSYSLKDVSFIKIDVEGHEAEVLQGAAGTISANRPVVLVEVKVRNREKILSFFSERDYTETSLERICGVVGSPENRIFLPREGQDN
jgi:FkbM family methyltransferase